jgi:aquaporin Z
VKKYLVELLGTFFLVLTIGSTVMAPNDAGALAPLAIGAVLIGLVFAGGHLSGAHYNPAVTLAVFLRGKCAVSDVPGYILTQCAGAAAAAMVVVFLKGNPAVTTMQIDVTRALAAEFFFTFALCFVILNVATSKGTS